MPTRPILRYPDARLRKLSEPVVNFDENLRALVEDMKDTMYLAEGAGLAAIQVGRNADDPPVVFANPEIIEISEEEQTGDEGCLSFPGIFVPVKRGMRAKVRAQDLEGKTFELEGQALLARALQHETDHLTGRLLIDMVGPVKRQIIKRKMRKENEAEAT